MKPDSELADIITAQEEEIVWDKFTTDEAWAVGNAIRDIFKQNYKPGYKGRTGIAVSIALFNGAVLFQGSIDDGVTPDNWNWVAGKTATVKRYSRSSFFVGRNAAAKGPDAVARLLKLAPELNFVAHGGALPIRLRGLDFTNPIGAIVVSGLPQEDDHQLVVDACRKVLSLQGTSSVRS
ncbi:hypothetical protein AURDEDRAFT_89434 [Auricularia subglabra TFB-10046 SS5]|nr:hypothetical protein AURDEDRAFT_89434 [Auricularia subglabra TFB-10046 SS5]